MFSFTRSRSRPKTGRLRNPAINNTHTHIHTHPHTPTHTHTHKGQCHEIFYPNFLLKTFYLGPFEQDKQFRELFRFLQRYPITKLTCPCTVSDTPC